MQRPFKLKITRPGSLLSVIAEVDLGEDELLAQSHLFALLASNTDDPSLEADYYRAVESIQAVLFGAVPTEAIAVAAR